MTGVNESGAFHGLVKLPFIEGKRNVFRNVEVKVKYSSSSVGYDGDKLERLIPEMIKVHEQQLFQGFRMKDL
jgi:hypothetical protein